MLEWDMIAIQSVFGDFADRWEWDALGFLRM